MKNVLHAAIMCAVLMGSAAMYAQDQAPPQGGGQQWGRGQGQPMTADQRLQRMTQQLNLTDAQQQQIKPILESETTQMDSLRQDTSLSQPDRMSKMMAIRQNSASQIKPILNADQQKKYDEMMSHRGRGPGGMPPQGAGQNQPPQQ